MNGANPRRTTESEMLNLTRTTLVLVPTGDNKSTKLAPAGKVASDCVHDGLILRGRRIDPGTGPMHTATLARPRRSQIEALNRLLENEIAKDGAATGRDGLVLIDRRLLQHVEPRLKAHVAAPHREHQRDRHEGAVWMSMLILPPEDPEPTREAATESKSYTLFLDHAGVAAATPETREIGQARTRQELQWMARGALPFEQGGRLWARDEEHHAVLEMTAIQQGENDRVHGL